MVVAKPLNTNQSPRRRRLRTTSAMKQDKQLAPNSLSKAALQRNNMKAPRKKVKQKVSIIPSDRDNSGTRNILPEYQGIGVDSTLNLAVKSAEDDESSNKVQRSTLYSMDFKQNPTDVEGEKSD